MIKVIKRYFAALSLTSDAFKNKKVSLAFWIIIRGISLCATPIIFPLTIELLFDAMENGDEFQLLVVSLTIVAYIVPIYVLNYLICYYSDVWVVKTTYEWMKNNVEKYIELPFMETNERFTDGEVSSFVISGSWAGVQAWIHLFRLISPLVSAFILGIFVIKSAWIVLPIVFIASLIDLILSEYESKYRLEINKHLMDCYSERAHKINEIVNKIESISMNNMYEFVLSDYNMTYQSLWNYEHCNVKCSIVIGTINKLLEYLLYCIISLSLFCLRVTNAITAGAVGSLNKNYSNFRDQIIYSKNQITNTVSKVEPIERLRNLLAVSRELIGYYDLSKESNIAIECNNLSFSNNNVDIIKNMSFQVLSGEKVAIIGENGSGKSTLLKLILGLYNPTQGHCFVFGKNTAAMNKFQREDFFSYAPAKDQIYKSLSVEDNIEMAFEHESKNNINHYLGKININDFLLQNSYNLSGGEGKRVNIGRCKIKPAKIFIYDEPTSSLDKENSDSVIDYILNNDGETVVFVTHDPEYVSKANRVIIMKNGRIVFFGEYKDCINSQEYDNWANKMNKERILV